MYNGTKINVTFSKGIYNDVPFLYFQLHNQCGYSRQGDPVPENGTGPYRQRQGSCRVHTTQSWTAGRPHQVPLCKVRSLCSGCRNIVVVSKSSDQYNQQRTELHFFAYICWMSGIFNKS